jgi:sulfur carrier protein ThiS
LKVVVESLGLPSLTALMGKRIAVEMTGRTLRDLIDHLIGVHGPGIREILLDRDGEPDATVQVMVENDFVSREEIACFLLKEGATVRFLLLVGGG